MFDAVLVANRGEIACRVMRTCRRLGIRTIAVYSDADAGARHVREADVAVRLGPPPARESYLDAQAIVRAARDNGAQAIHPGYGFLSEKLELIDACAAAGLVFVGPHRDAIARMGSKIESKRIARAAGVPCVPGYDGDDQDAATLVEAAGRIGFPLLIKASAGGGGKGMKRVDGADAFIAQLAAARGEALAAFGDDRVLLERYVQRPRHLEVQLLGDRHGGLVHLFERECSIQRNYQKIVEEAPAGHLSDAVREKLFDAALSLGRTIGYDSVGTVEFVLDADRPDEPWFLEMNTRLQVEHPVTELTVRLLPAGPSSSPAVRLSSPDAPSTSSLPASPSSPSIDLVEWQIRGAAGERLPFEQAQVARRGWAIEARINAEVPDAGFAPSFGRVERYEEPRADGLRVDSGIDAASDITPHYDSLLAKVIASGASRAAARDSLVSGVRGLRIEGVRTNQALLIDLLEQPAFDRPLTTRFLVDAYPDGWRPDDAQTRERVGAAAACWYFARLRATRTDRPLHALVGFRLTAAAGRGAATLVSVNHDGTTDAVTLQPPTAATTEATTKAATTTEATTKAATTTAARTIDGLIGDRSSRYEETTDGVVAAGRRYAATIDASRVGLWHDGDWQTFTVVPAVAATRSAADASIAGDVIAAEMPGLVARVLVARGQSVARGDPVVVMEAMKLMYTLVAPRDGTIASLPVDEGATVARGTVLATFEAEGTDDPPRPEA